MNLWVVSFTEKGADLNLRLSESLRSFGHTVSGYDKTGKKPSGPLKAAGLQPFVKQHKSIALPV